MKTTFFFETEGSINEHCLTAPVFAVKAWERGYYPIHTPLSAKELNKDIPDNVLEAALLGSVCGWHVPGAMDAAKWCEQQEKEAALA